MTLLLNAVFEEIEKKEQEAHNVYKRIAKMLDNEDDKKNILMLADQELAHDNFFSTNKKSVATISEDELKNLAIFIKGKDPNTITDVSELLDFAILEENRAEESYRVLAEHLPDDADKKELLKIADHEKHHAIVLQRIKSHL